ncbi:unnamed protein product [Fusarium graminearum]|uniref:Uncharacterized protein n=1 Tax=Gibberella zeae TaxID=5518 RepID=A0A8H3JH29_GIBZA|nr:unnamed protein product [Fusarium graminearum]CAF3585614.1 unnamed protein product [Fusarium graminearum]CAG1963892.1 unnamed protein product [Fusarium graminearum]CAG1985681.1 unnamed protein product [Fusarium graminearum]CAG1987064.1 unnamed protein product [Fusarium graminearum]
MAPPDLSASATSSATGTPAGYGRACTACQRAKCKCILRASGQDCERCHRLGKPCQTMATSRKRVAKKSTSSRTAQLEEKLEDLVTILRAAQPSNGNLQPSNSGESSPLMNSSNMCHLTSRLESLATAAASSSSSETQPRSYPAPHSYGSKSTGDSHMHTSPSSIGGDTSSLPEPTPEEAEVYLRKFKTWLEKFPCIVLPQDMTAAALRKEKPFLWLCIMNITSMSVEQQIKMKDQVRQEIATRIIINHERSMDCLQGIICYVTWASTTSSPGKPFIVTFCQMAVLVAYELGLTKAPVEEQYFTVCFKLWGGRPAPPRLRTLEERRTVLSLWFLTSVMSSFIGKMETLHWTPHMSDCLDVLEREKRYPSDELLTAFIRYQLVADEAQKLLVRDVMGDPSPPPTYIFRKSLLAKLQAVRDGLPLNMPMTRKYMMSNCCYAMLTDADVLQAHALVTEVQVNSVGLFMQNIPVNQRIESMYACLRAIRTWYDVFFSIPAEEVAGVPFAVYIQLSQVQIALYRLTTSEDPAWDKEVVRHTADLLVLLDQVIEFFTRIDSVYRMKASAGEETVFLMGAKIMRNIRNSWEPILSRHLSSVPLSTENQRAVQSMPAQNPQDQQSIDMAAVNMMDFGDITWMSDVFGPWEF